MRLKHSIALTTRTSDLDSLRHVNNKVYEQLCAEGRYRLLAEQGYALETLLDQAIALRPVATYVRFSLQQKAGTTLTIDTEAFPLGAGTILWDHHLRQPDGKTGCHLQAKTQALDHQQRPVELLPATGEDPPPVLIEPVPGFAGQCARITSAYAACYTDMDVFGHIPIAAFWRIFEEGRHMFGEQLGLTLERFVQLDTHFFWGGGTYQFYQPLRPGQPLRIHTWLERVVRIRAFIRQEIRSANGDELLGASREEHLIVALAATRPKALPAELAALLEPYVEYRG